MTRACVLAPALLIVGCLATPLVAQSMSERSAAELMDVVMWNREPIGGPFALVDQNGRRRTEADFRGKLMLVYFGFTYCPDVCPTELGTMAAALDAMGPAGEAVVPVLITVDPERDGPAQLADYVSRFHPRLVGLTGTPEQVAEAARRYRVYYAKARRPEMTEYLVDHSGFTYLVGPDGRVRTLFRPGTSPEAMAAALSAQLANRSAATN